MDIFWYLGHTFLKFLVMPFLLESARKEEDGTLAVVRSVCQSSVVLLLVLTGVQRDGDAAAKVQA